MDDQELNSAVARFSAKFLYEVHKKKNLVCSPLSVEYLMGLMTLGASDPSLTELLDVLGYKDEDSVRSAFTTMTSELMSPKEVTLQSATRIFVKQECETELNPRFQQDAADVFNAGVESLSFDDGSASADHINKWVEKQTEGKITDLVKPNHFNQSTILVAVNALYFKGGWARPFPVEETRSRPFRINAEKTIDIPMMTYRSPREMNIKYIPELDAKLLELPYHGGETSMIIALPCEADGLEPMLKTLKEGFNISDGIKEMHSRRMYVTVPKFKIESEINLIEPLQNMGVETIFSDSKSQLNKILKDGRNVCVSRALQKAVIEVNEEGTEAAAAGAMWIKVSKPPSFKADHPFLFILTGHKRVPLFIGVFYGE